MSLEIGRFTPMQATLAARPPARREPVAVTDTAAIPPSPPASVLADVERAALRAADLAAANRELHFYKDPESGRIIVQVRDLDGRVLRVIPASEALDVMSGGAV